MLKIKKNLKTPSSNILNFISAGILLGFAHILPSFFSISSFLLGFTIFLNASQNQYLNTNRLNVFFKGWLFGFFFFLISSHWISFAPVNGYGKSYWYASAISLVGIPCLLATFKGCFLLIYSIISKFKCFIKWRFAIWLFLYITFEYLQVLSGFPLGLSAYIYNCGIIAQTSYIWGIWGLGLFALSLVVVPYCIFNEYRSYKFIKWKTIAFILLIFTVFIYGHIRIYKFQEEDKNIIFLHSSKTDFSDAKLYHMGKKDHLIITIIQPNVDQMQKDKNALKICLSLIKNSLKIYPKTNLFILPETILNHQGEIFHFNKLSQNADFIVGGHRVEKKYKNYGFKNKYKPSEIKVYNTAYHIHFNNECFYVNYYDKMHLVPFGEYIPLSRILPNFILNLSPIMDLEHGNFNKVFKLPNHMNALPVICFESIFIDEIVKRIHINNADIIINLTNDAWFKGSVGHKQHLSIVKLLAITTGKNVIRSTVDGISTVIDKYGKCFGVLEKSVRGFVCVQIKPQTKHKSFFDQSYINLYYGQLLALLLFSIILLVFCKPSEIDQ